MPQLFAMIETYEATHPNKTSEPHPSICVMLEATNINNAVNAVNATLQKEEFCAPVMINLKKKINYTFYLFNIFLNIFLFAGCT